jgi:WhiB family redox-sensing transcriptional regulator
VVALIVAGRQRVNVKTVRRIVDISVHARARFIRYGWDTRRGRSRYDQLAAEWDHRKPVVLPLPKPDVWVEKALCAQVAQELFFPELGQNGRESKRICVGCEVRKECLEFALENDIEHGIFGGLSAQERRRERRMRNAQDPPA